MGNTFVVGDTVKCLRNIEFLNGDKHVKNGMYVITSEELAYYNVNHKDYVLIKESITNDTARSD